MSISEGQKRLRSVVIFGAPLPALITALALELALIYELPEVYVRVAVYAALAGIFYLFVVIGVWLYWLRESTRWFYGLIEIAAALVLLFLSIFFQVPREPPQLGSSIYTVPFITSILQTLAAWYVLVRGLDNLGQGLKKYPTWHRRWQWVSLRPVDPAPESEKENPT
jgi:hypothetical protein